MQSTSNSNMYSQVDYKSSSSTAAAGAAAKAEWHSFQVRFFRKPVLCMHCRDYIWGQGHVGLGCVACGQHVHTKCKLFVASQTCRPVAGSNTLLDATTSATLCTIDTWSVETVKQWLAVCSLHRYAEVFATYAIDGTKLLALDVYQLYAFRIRDPYHHAAIMEARDELVQRARHASSSYLAAEQERQQREHLVANPYKSEHHHFLLHTLASVGAHCHMCSRRLLGIHHQCLMCQQCGLVVHRQCASTGLPLCALPLKGAIKEVFD